MYGSPIRIYVAAVFIVAASFIPTKAKAQDEYKAPRNADVDARGARTVRIDAAAGNLRVEGRTGLTEVRVRGTARASRRSQLESIKLLAERRGSEVYVRAEIPDDARDGWRAFSPGHFMALDLVIEVPISLPLEVDDGSGEARFINTGPLTLEDGSGEIEIRGARGDVDVTDGSGTIVIDGVEGNVKISDGSGEIRARNVTGDVTVEEDGSGDIDVAEVGGTVRVEDDGSGNIDVGRVAGDFVVGNDGGGSIRYDTVKGSVRIPERKRRG
jgi:hypothetical protein